MMFFFSKKKYINISYIYILLLDFVGIKGLNESQQQQQQQQLVGVNGGAPLTSDISTFEESAYKVGRLSVEERKEKIHRYMKKRNERNFTKKIKVSLSLSTFFIDVPTKVWDPIILMAPLFSVGQSIHPSFDSCKIGC